NGHGSRRGPEGPIPVIVRCSHQRASSGTHSVRTIRQSVGRCVFEGQLDVARLVYFHDEDNAALRIAGWEGLARVLVRDRVHSPEIAVGAALDDASAQLGFGVRIVHVHDGKRDPRVAPGVPGLERTFTRADQDAVALTRNPDRSGLWRTI